MDATQIETAFRAMCAGYEPGDGSMDGAQLVDGEWWHPMFGCDSLQMVVDRAHALLDQPVAEGPMVADLHRMAFSYSQPCFDFEYIPFAFAVLARWGRPTPQPVPVSERPWERDGWCDEQGRCWWELGKAGPLPTVWWMVSIPQSCTAGIMLPANALPTPEDTNE